VRNIILVATAALVVLIVGTAIGASGSHDSGSPAVAPQASASHTPSPSPFVTDANGQTCVALDAANYCPGDDPEPPTPTPSGPDQLSTGQTETIADSTDTTVGTVKVEDPTVTTSPADPSYGSRPAHGWYVIVKIDMAADPGYTDGWGVCDCDFYALVGGRHYDSGNGNSYEALKDYQSAQSISFTNLGAGESAAGYVAFDLPSRHGKIVYSPNSDSQPVAEWSY